MKRRFKLKDPYLGIKAGTEIEAEQVELNVVTFMWKGKKKMVPKTFLIEIPTTSAPDPQPDPNQPFSSVPHTPFSATLDPNDANDLSAQMGFTGQTTAFGNLDPVVPDPPKPKPKLKANEFFMSDMTGGRLPKSGIDHIMVKHPDAHWTDSQRADIPEVDQDYVWNEELLEAMWMSYKHNKKMLLTGWPGTGKTTAAFQFGAWVRHPVMRFNGKDSIEASSFLGMIWATSNGMEWRDGMMPQGVREGYIVIIDEVMKIPSGIQMSLQSLYEENGYLILDDKPGTHNDKKVLAHPNFRMFLTDNAKGLGDNFAQLTATQIQDVSTLDRYGITAEVGYLSAQLETDMLMKKYPGMQRSEVESLIQFANLVRTGYIQSQISISLSPRGLQTICELYADIPIMTRCIEMTYLAKLADPDEIDAIHEMLRTVY